MKKLLSLILVLCFAMSMVGCASKANDANGTSVTNSPSPTSAPAATATVAPTAAPTATPAPESGVYPAVDLGGRVIKIGANYDVVPANSDYVIQKSDADPTAIQDVLDRMKKVEAKYNCKIQYVNIPYDQRIQSITDSVMSGDPVADFIFLDIGQILPLAHSGMLDAFEDIVPANADMFNAQIHQKPQGKLFGKTYGTLEVGPLVNADMIVVNNDIINSLGLSETPLDLYNKGEWTWDKFLEIAKAATKDTNGDGKVDQFGISGPIGSWFSMLVASNSGKLFDENTGTEQLSSKNTMEALDMINTLYNVDKVALVSGKTLDWDPNLNSYKDGTSAMYYTVNYLMPDNENKMPFDFTVVPCPKGPSSTDDVRYFQTMVAGCIPKGVKDPGIVYQIYEEFMTPLDSNAYQKTMDDTVAWMAGKYNTQEDIDRVFDVSSKDGMYDLSRGIPEYPVNDILTAVVDNGQTPAQAVESYKKIAQDKIDAIFKN